MKVIDFLDIYKNKKVLIFFMKSIKLTFFSLILYTTLISDYAIGAQLENENVALININTTVLSAVKLIKNKKYARACAELNNIPKFSVVDVNDTKKEQLQLNVYYLLGQCYSGLGLTEQAKTYFEKVVMFDPTEPRPYLDLALTYQYLGKFSLANRQYRRLLKMPNLEPSLKEKIKHLKQINPSSLQYYVEISSGVISDSNINNGPLTDSITIYDEEFFLNNETLPISAVGINAGLKMSATKLLDNTSSASALVNFTSTTFIDNEDHNNYVIDLSLGYRQKVWGGEYSIQPRLASVFIGSESFLNVLGVNANYSHLLGRDIRMTYQLGYQSLSYSEDTTRDLVQLKPELMMHYQLVDDLLLYTKLGKTFGSADDGSRSYTDTSFTFGTDYALDVALLMSLTYKYNPADYSEESEGFGIVRSDTRTSLSAELSYNLKGYSLDRLTFELGAKVYEASSNIEIYENERTQVYATLIFTL